MGVLQQFSNQVDSLEDNLNKAHKALDSMVARYESIDKNVQSNDVNELMNLYRMIDTTLEKLGIGKGLLSGKRDEELDRYILGSLVGSTAVYLLQFKIAQKHGKNTAKPKEYEFSHVYDEILAAQDYGTVNRLCAQMEEAHEYKLLQRIENQLFYSTKIPRFEVTLHTNAQ